MKARTFMVIMLALVMTLSCTLIPSVIIADDISFSVQETIKLSRLDKVWKSLCNTEAETISSGYNRTQVINSVFETALNLDFVDIDSFSDFSEDGFIFTVDGMYCTYNYRLRNEINHSALDDNNAGKITVYPSNGKKVQLRDAGSPDVLLIGPYYGIDNTFTDQYRNEAASIADATGGTVTEIAGHSATGPAIVENYLNKGVVIYDSHGIQVNDSTYLCLTNNEGITSEDYENGWAVSSGKDAFIDGRYIEHHVAAPLSNCFVWMATCEGMKREGRGTTGTALLNAGAGVVYGYSQSVTFSGEYIYEETFWNAMKDKSNPSTVADAYNIMVDTNGAYDPHGDAYPIVMSSSDPFPLNPDSPQNVISDWMLFNNPESVSLTSFSIDRTELEFYLGKSENITFAPKPKNANNYNLIWSSDNESVAVVIGNNHKAAVTGISAGNANITCTIMINGQVFDTVRTRVTIDVDKSLCDSLNVPGGNIQFGIEGYLYGFEPVTEDDRYFAKSNNNGAPGSEAIITTTLNMQEGDTFDFEYFVSSEKDCDWYTFYVDEDQLQHISGRAMTEWERYTFTAPSDGNYRLTWSYRKNRSGNSGEDCIKLDNMDFSGVDPVEITAFSVSPINNKTCIGQKTRINFNREPLNANAYELIWTSDNNDIAIVNGTRNYADITGISCGTANITCTVLVEGDVFGNASCVVNVVDDTSLNYALNVENGTIQFVSQDSPYGFEPVTEDNRFCGKSNNNGAANSNAVMTANIYMEENETLKFEYFISSESNHDWYMLSVNGAQIQRLSGQNTDWATYTFTSWGKGDYTFVWSYVKDGSRDEGQDCVKIDNVSYSGENEEPPVTQPPVTQPPVTQPPVTQPPVVTEPDGDVNLDGSMTTVDVLLAVRFAAQLALPTEEQILHGDIDNNGIFEMNDAVLIFRIVLGL